MWYFIHQCKIIRFVCVCVCVCMCVYMHVCVGVSFIELFTV
jgi:hypothetical protein